MSKNSHELIITKWGIAITVVGILAVLTIANAFFNNVDHSYLGTLGDFIGGFSNPIIAFLSAILIWRTLVAQIKMNEEQIRLLENEKSERISDTTRIKEEEAAKHDFELMRFITDQIQHLPEYYNRCEILSNFGMPNAGNLTGAQAIQKYKSYIQTFKISGSEKNLPFLSMYTDLGGKIIMFLSQCNLIVENIKLVSNIEIRNIMNSHFETAWRLFDESIKSIIITNPEGIIDFLDLLSQFTIITGAYNKLDNYMRSGQ